MAARFPVATRPMKLNTRHEKLALLLDQGRFSELEARAGEVLKNRPHDAPLWYLLGIGRLRSGSFAGARQAFEHVIALRPDYAPAHNNLGSALYSLQDFAGAAEAFKRAVAADPTLLSARRNLGVALQALHRNGEAIDVLRDAIDRAPDDLENRKVLGSLLLGVGRAGESADVFDAALAIAPGHQELASFRMFAYQYLADRTPQAVRAAAEHFGALLWRDRRPSFDFSRRRAAADPGRAPRVGLVSADLGQHPVGYFLDGVVSAIDRTRVQLVAFSNRPPANDDALTARLRAAIPEWHAIYGLADDAAARLIHDFGIDVLVDLSGHTDGGRLGVFAYRPAPVQATWLGWYSTTGLAAIDYIVADDIVLPPAEEAHFTERPWRLPDSYYCYTAPDVDLSPGPLPAIANRHLTFGCFNRRLKITAPVIDCWSRVLAAVPQSRLILKCTEFGDPEIRISMTEEFERRGIAAGRLVLEGPSTRAEYFAAFRRVDLALDTFCFTGGTTTIDGLWMGVPCVTLAGDRFIGHQGETILRRVGLSDWIATDADDYVAIAARAAADLDGLARLREGLRERLRASPICDAARFARHLETAFRGMWSVWLDRP